MNLTDQTPNHLKKAIIQTLAFFDIFDFPLTPWEVWKFLYRARADFLEVFCELEKLVKEKKLETSMGFYFFPGRGGTVMERAQRFIFAKRKYKIAMRFSKILSFFPFVRMIAVCNTLSLSSARDTSDIDFFIVAKKGRVWTARLISVFLAKILRMRVSEKRARDKICLSFFATDAFSQWEKISNSPEDIYLLYWISNLAPQYSEENIFTFLCGKSSFVRELLTNIFQKIPSRIRRIKGQRKIKKLLERALSGQFGDWLESAVKLLQMKKMPQKLRDMSKLGDTRVILTDEILKFHSNDRRDIFLKKWKEKISSYEKIF